MSESRPKGRSTLVGLSTIALVALAACFAIHKASALQPQQNASVQFTIHLKTLDCQVQAYKILGNKTSGYFDSGDSVQQALWSLARRCNGTITTNALPNRPLTPVGPDRKG